MTRIYDSLTELIGNTPLIEVHNIEQSEHLHARLLVKAEAFNPGGSAKDRIALTMIEDAERKGTLPPGGTIIEPTSGNTGIGLAWVASVKGYDVILTMPETMSIERQRLLKALGARLVLTPGNEGMKGAIARAEQICRDTPGSVILQQFSNPANPAAHRQATGLEIWNDTDGKIDIFIAGVGTGGTISGVAELLRSRKPSVRVIAVEPATSAVLSGRKPGAHRIQGIGAGFIPANYNPDVIDEVVPVTESEAASGSRLLAQKEGILSGISSGAAFAVALSEARKPENKGKTIVVLLPDTGERYLSTDLFTTD